MAVGDPRPRPAWWMYFVILFCLALVGAFTGGWWDHIFNYHPPSHFIVTATAHVLMAEIDDSVPRLDAAPRMLTISADESEQKPAASGPFWPWEPFAFFDRPDSNGFTMRSCSVGVGIDPLQLAIVEVFKQDDAEHVSRKLDEPFIIGIAQHAASCDGYKFLLRYDKDRGLLYSTRIN